MKNTLIGPVETYLIEKIKANRTIHFTLVDPEKFSPVQAAKLASQAQKAGSAAILVGGSTVGHASQLDSLIKSVKKSVKIPVILFPGNISGISKFADAILFMSLLNSTNPYFLIGAQALGAPIIRRYELEPIPMGYIILGYGGTAGVVGYARSLPYDKPELAGMHALAAQYLGMRFVYLEAGSGADEPIPPQIISYARKILKIPIIVGGGLKNASDAKKAADAGANIIVTGTLTENSAAVREKLQSLILNLN